jgi:flagellar motor switch protein FliN
MDDFHPSDPAAMFVCRPEPSAPGPESLPAPNCNLLRIKVPVTITLASKKQAVGNIINLVPGAILRFDKSCHEKLDLEVGARRIAQGECVEVGDRLGLRISSLILPAERSRG